MTVAFGTTGASGVTADLTNATSVAVPYPASIAAGDLLIVKVGQHYSIGSGSITTPAGWTLIGALADGNAQVFGVDTGPARIMVAAKIADGTESGNLTVTVTEASGIVTVGRMSRYTKASNMNWDFSSSGTGQDSSITTDTTFAATTGTNIDLAVGDLVVYAYAQPTDTLGIISTNTYSASGITFGAITSRGRGTTSNDNDAQISYGDASVTAGSGTVAVTHTVVFSAASNNHGPEVIVRLREVSPPATKTDDFFAFF